MQQFDFGFAAAGGTTTRARAKAREADWRRPLALALITWNRCGCRVVRADVQLGPIRPRRTVG